MNIHRTRRNREQGQALVFVLLTSAISLSLLASLLNRTATTSFLNDRSNRYLAAVSAAEAASEKTLASVMWDYTRSGAATVANRMNHYPTLVPALEEDTYWSQYRFEDLEGWFGRISVEQTQPWKSGTPLISQYSGLSGYASTYRIGAVARETDGENPVAARVEQHIQLATIPIFQFAIFYNLDLEINPGPDMTVAGRVHSNQRIYAQPVSTLTFADHVTAADQIIHDKKPGDPSHRDVGSIHYESEQDSNVNTLNLPIGTDNTPANVRQIIELPAYLESPSSPIAQQRFYNQSDLVVVVRDGPTVGSPPAIEVSGQRTDGITLATVSSFMQFTNASFYNKREEKTVKAIQVDVTGLQAHAPGVHSLYVDDQRALSSSTQPGLKVVNGQTLPTGGLTISTRLPLYVQGDYNAPGSARGTSDTSGTQPAALIADAITVLSDNWSDANSTKSLGSRKAAHTTINAAFLAGIVETSSKNGYSGGVENFPRFLEDWGGKVLTYNGSMVVMFQSAIADGDWRGTGGNIGIYNPPVRNWSFDKNFLDPTKLPPLTPQALTAIRGQWVMGAAPTPGT